MNLQFLFGYWHGLNCMAFTTTIANIFETYHMQALWPSSDVLACPVYCSYVLQVIYFNISVSGIQALLHAAHVTSMLTQKQSCLLYYIATVNVEIFAGLNICNFSHMNFFTWILLWCLGQQCLLFKFNYD